MNINNAVVVEKEHLLDVFLAYLFGLFLSSNILGRLRNRLSFGQIYFGGRFPLPGDIYQLVRLLDVAAGVRTPCDQGRHQEEGNPTFPVFHWSVHLLVKLFFDCCGCGLQSFDLGCRNPVALQGNEFAVLPLQEEMKLLISKITP
ncbi:MAG: hypothetical protein K0R67_578 [Paenibacillus sp.]|nr:hypothetical protein [Paenibacillus sp.]